MKPPVNSSIFLVFLLLLFPCFQAFLPLSADAESAGTREAVWAGRFYPAGPEELRSTISALMEKARKIKGAEASHGHSGRLRALIFPHAGYQYSGMVAARSALELEGSHFSTVIIMGPDHQAGFGNVALSDCSGYATPLGVVRISPLAQGLRAYKDIFRPVPRSDRNEHSIEVVLPFLQVTLGDFTIIPLVIGPCSTDKVSSALLPLAERDDTLFVVSSDLSHYLPYDQATGMDKKTIEIIMSLDPHALKAHENRACGVYALKVLMAVASRLGWRPELLLYRNSGDTWGGRSRVVGYVSLAFYE